MILAPIRSAHPEDGGHNFTMQRRTAALFGCWRTATNMRATGHPHSPLLKEGLYFAAADAASEHDQELKSPERIPPVDRTSAPDYPPPSHARKETGSQELLIQDDSQQFLYLPDAIIGPRDQRLRLRPFLNLNPNGSQSPPSGRKPAPSL